MARFAHRLPWGAEVLDGGARFKLWAPAQDKVSLLSDSGATVSMTKESGGWFEVTTDAIPLDSGYHFVLADGMRVPDPAARAQMGDVHGPSRLVDPKSYEWRNAGWKGRPWEEAVIYELHTGTFSADGTFDGVVKDLDRLVDVGITAVELLPVAQFAGNRGWGYDGVLHYAPHVAYGGPEGLKRLVDACHARGLMILLDVVYNHFGPDGNYLHLYAPDFFNAARHTPWGSAIDYERAPVREFFLHNVLYWLEEYRFDGLRLDAIDQIKDPSQEEILAEMAREVRARFPDRHVHLTIEDDENTTRLFKFDAENRPRLFDAEWNDDWHHAMQSLLAHDDAGYYQDYADNPVKRIAETMATGFGYQGGPSPFRGGKPRGEPSAHLPPTAFIDFLQNHDQVGNRAQGDRITTLAAPQAIAAALALRPCLLVLDEPTSQLDPQSAEEVLTALVRLNRDLGLTMVLAEHRLERILPHVHRLIYLPTPQVEGGMGEVLSGPPRQVLHQMDLTPPLVTLGKALGWEPLPLTVEEARRFAKSQAPTSNLQSPISYRNAHSAMRNPHSAIRIPQFPIPCLSFVPCVFLMTALPPCAVSHSRSARGNWWC